MRNAGKRKQGFPSNTNWMSQDMANASNAVTTILIRGAMRVSLVAGICIVTEYPDFFRPVLCVLIRFLARLIRQQLLSDQN